jgi:prespore-specific regulator
MSTVRQDAWNEDEDLLLAETVLRHIREGSTQLAAFEEVGKKLSRTSAACGFRWNSLVRKRYENAISLAKKQRKELAKKNKEANKAKKERPPIQVVEDTSPVTEETISLKQVIAFLEKLDREGSGQQDIEEQLLAVQKERDDLHKAYQKLTAELNSIKSDYQSLIQIMDRARRYTKPFDAEAAREEEKEWEEVSEVLTSESEKE